MSYPEAVLYLESLINYENSLNYNYKDSVKLERIRNFLQLLNNPQDSLRCIHVAGSKGKGSTCAFIAYILREAGFNVGLYTSPHLSDFRERIRILPGAERRAQGEEDYFEGLIPRPSLVKLVKKLKPVIKRYNRTCVYGPLTFFEAYTALAFMYFKEAKADFVVLETGLGGRLDATNVVLPLVCAITPISYEHTDKLGKTLSKIATEKAGIIKEGTIVISAPQQDEAKEIIVKRCLKQNAKLYLLGKDIKIVVKGNCFTVSTAKGEYGKQRIKLCGRHQLDNAGVAVGVIEALQQYGIKVNANAIRRGLSNTLWPGRCEVIKRKPVIVLDGAQNVDSCKVLVKAIKDNFKYRRLILVLGVSSDKDILGMSRELYDLANVVILTRSLNPRASDPVDLAKYFKNKEKYITGNVKEARLLIRRLAGEGDLVLVTGSLFLVGEFRDDKK